MSLMNGTLFSLIVGVVGDQAADDDGLLVAHHDRRRRRADGRRRAELVGVDQRADGTSAETSSKRSRRTMPPSEICGVMRSVMPTSRRSMVAKVLPRLVSLVERRGDERDVLADDDLGLLVVGGEDVRRREDVDVGVALRRA